MADIHHSSGDFSRSAGLQPDAPWAWLAAGWRDTLARPGISLVYGLIFAGVSGLLTLALVRLEAEYLLLPAVAGFMLVGPMLAVGLYETSRRLAAGEPVTLGSALLVSTRSPSQLAFLGAILMFLLLAWIRLAQLIYALFFGMAEFPGLQDSINLLFFTDSGLSMLLIGGALGGVIAATVFSISAFAVPMLMVRDMDAITAMIRSVTAVRAHIRPMLLWAALIVAITAAGIVTLYVGLVIAFPLLGHASWHAYRQVIDGVPPRV